MSAPSAEEVVAQMFGELPPEARVVALAMARSVFEGRAQWARGQARGIRAVPSLAAKMEPLAGLYDMVAEADDAIVDSLRGVK